ncbi:MAG: ATPase, T2SS/T4P/T4SS family [Polyangiaceae bacterium]
MTERLADILAPLGDIGGATIHLGAGRVPKLRRGGALVAARGAAPIAARDLEAMVRDAVPPEIWATQEATGSASVAVELEPLGRFRLQLFARSDGLGVVLRPLVPAATLESLEVPRAFRSLLAALGSKTLLGGLVIVAGPCGSGKTTACHAILRELGQRWDAHLATVEDPVELVLPRTRSTLSQWQVGRDVASFSEGIDRALHVSPDALLVTAMPDAETAEGVLAAAQGGLTVVVEIEADGVVRALESFVERFEPRHHELVWERLASCLRGVISQLLIPGRDGSPCLAAEVLVGPRAGVIPGLSEGDGARLYEVMARAEVCQTRDEALLALVDAGQIRAEDAADHARDRSRFARPERA